MTIRLFRPKNPRLEWYEKTASTAFTNNDLVALTTTGRLIRYVAGGAYPILGLIQKTVAATDSTTDLVPVLVDDPDAEYIFDVSTGTPAISDVGEYVDLDDHDSADVDTSTNNEIYVTGFLSGSTQIIGKLVRRTPRVFE